MYKYKPDSPNMLPKRMPRNKQDVQTTNLDTMEKGMRALSPFQLFQSAQTMKLPTKPQNRPITVALSHAYLDSSVHLRLAEGEHTHSFPPHWTASNNIITLGANKANPRRSSLLCKSLTTSMALGLTTSPSGIRLKISMAATIAPGGRLM